MSHEERMSDMPAPLRWAMIIMKNFGFATLMCAYFMYREYNQDLTTFKALTALTNAVNAVQTAVEDQNRILRHHHKDD